MQPYYFPYIGYFSHIFASDLYVLHDDVKYTKKGWINRNRIMSGTNISNLTLSLSRAPDTALIKEKWIAPEYSPEKQFRIIEGAYRKAPFWDELRANLPELLGIQERNLAAHLKELIKMVCQLLEIETRITLSSELEVCPELIGQARVIAICKAVGANSYLNPEGGEALYDRKQFRNYGLNLVFLSHIPQSYAQRHLEQHGHVSDSFVGRLSVLDSLAEIGLEKTRLSVQRDFELYTAP